MNQGIGIRRGRIGKAALGAGIAAALIVFPAGAQALTVSGTAAPANLQAGANSDYTITVNFGPAGENVENLIVGLPPGQIGDPQATPLCTLAQLNSATTPGNDGCPANTQVGSVSVAADITIAMVPVPVTVTGKLFNLVPQPGEPARFGIVLQPGNLGGGVMAPLDPVILQSGARLRTSDFGLDTVVNNIPNQTDGLPTRIKSQTITLFGTAPGTGKPFSRNPTQCTPKTVTFSATSYENPGTTATGSAPPYTPTNCAAVPFSPEFTAKIGAPGFTAPSTKPPITTAIKQTADEAGIQNTVVFLPGVLGADPSLFSSACDISAFNAGTCPEISIIGSATAATPLLTVPLQGPVAIVSEPGNPVPKLGLDLRGSLPLKLTGSFVLEGGTGVQFSGLPDIPISNFELKFRENTLATASVNLCKPPTPTFNTSFIAYSEATQAGPTAATVEGCVPPRKPGVKVKVKGQGDNAQLKLKVSAGSSKLREIQLKLPKSLSFGDPQAFDKGLKKNITGGNAFIKNGARKLKVTLPSGADKVVVKVGNGGLIRKSPAKPRFRVQVIDEDATRTSVTVPKKGKKKKKKK